MMMEQSKVYISLKAGTASLILETPTATDGQEAYQQIKSKIPSANLGIYGARDIQTLLRSHREFKAPRVFTDIEKFISSATVIKKVLV
ncbi:MULTISPECIES: hypothetical protein [Heyndrickxia]|jgi:hypothetical protein|uniref:hypothetical protein n=1 Tax=Heyndrickxia TaxID=2837504 RepID=UPI00126A47C4|nr:hypothetical protein [Heyndrickxia coagulans]UZH07759.1 hypothetical protein ONG97_07640 [Heyndrickxia coagulans]